jgi:ABC-type maltose transport system permease subunit
VGAGPVLLLVLVVLETVDHLNDDEAKVEGDPNGECRLKIFRAMYMPMTAAVCMVMAVVVIVIGIWFDPRLSNRLLCYIVLMNG